MSEYLDLILWYVPSPLDHRVDCLLALAFGGARFFTKDSAREG
jgi:hypothetical protein